MAGVRKSTIWAENSEEMPQIILKPPEGGRGFCPVRSAPSVAGNTTWIVAPTAVPAASPRQSPRRSPACRTAKRPENGVFSFCLICAAPCLASPNVPPSVSACGRVKACVVLHGKKRWDILRDWRFKPGLKILPVSRLVRHSKQSNGGRLGEGGGGPAREEALAHRVGMV